MRVCPEPGCGVLTAGGRCGLHRIASPTERARDWAERRRRAAAVEAWIAQEGYWCPGYGVLSHPATDLTADHVVAVVHGGTDGDLQVLCRSCNSRKGDR